VLTVLFGTFFVGLCILNRCDCHLVCSETTSNNRGYLSADAEVAAERSHYSRKRTEVQIATPSSCIKPSVLSGNARDPERTFPPSVQPPVDGEEG
jgi:hypothetical protein